MPYKAKTKQSMKSHSELQVLETYFSIPLNGCIVCLLSYAFLEVFSFGFVGKGRVFGLGFFTKSKH